MGIELRIILIVAAALALASVIGRVRKSTIKISDATFWVIFAIVILILAIFPQIPMFVSSLLGFETASNFIFFCSFVILFIYSFHQTIRISELQHKLVKLAQRIALRDADRR